MSGDIILYTSEDGKSRIKLYERDGLIWLNQLQMAELFATSKQNINLHISKILIDKELDANSGVKEYLTTALATSKWRHLFIRSLTNLMPVGRP